MVIISEAYTQLEDLETSPIKTETSKPNVSEGQFMYILHIYIYICVYIYMYTCIYIYNLFRVGGMGQEEQGAPQTRETMQFNEDHNLSFCWVLGHTR